jgi:hypothetical protein
MDRMKIDGNVKNHIKFPFSWFFISKHVLLGNFWNYLKVLFTGNFWKYCFVATFCVFSFSVANGQTIDTKIPKELTNDVQIETQSPLYNAAFLEISDMLDGRQPLSIKRAVFLAEWAYLDGKLDYEEFCKTIDNAADFVKRFIRANAMEKYKTAKNMALIEYFFHPYSGNGHKPFTYNFSDIDGTEDFTQQFVSKVMQTHRAMSLATNVL